MTYTVQENYMQTQADFETAVAWFAERTCCRILESGIYPDHEYWFIKSEHNTAGSMMFLYSSLGHLFFNPEVPAS